MGYRLFIASVPSCSDNKQNGEEEGVDCGLACGVSCAVKNAQEIKILPVDVLLIKDKSTFVFEIENPNPKVGIAILPYVINIFDTNDNRAYFFNRTTFIYPGEKKMLIAANVNIRPDQIGRATLTLDYLPNAWIEVSDFEPPRIGLEVADRRLVDNQIIVSGRVINDNAFDVSDITVLGIAENNIGLRASVSQTIIDRLAPFSQKDFTITLPVSDASLADINVQGVKVFVSGRR